MEPDSVSETLCFIVVQNSGQWTKSSNIVILSIVRTLSRLYLILLFKHSVITFQNPSVAAPKYSSSPYHKFDSPHHFDKAELPYPYSPFYTKSRTPPMIFEIGGFDNTENIRDYSEEGNGYYYSDQFSSAPADAVSLALAYQLAKRAGTAITEDVLSFGPRTIPVNGAVTRARNYVPEERLFAFDKQAGEMRYPSARCGISTQEQALLAAQEGYRESPCGGSANYRTYADVGYIPEYL
jgi:hypothetical protein